MEYKVLLTVFVAVFIAELGDKTQLATMLFAADKEVSKLTVFVGSSLALVMASYQILPPLNPGDLNIDCQVISGISSTRLTNMTVGKVIFSLRL